VRRKKVPEGVLKDEKRAQISFPTRAEVFFGTLRQKMGVERGHP